MSKMASKKKSCFQITSVITQSHMTANSPAEDTEGQVDNEETTKTEEASTSEIYDSVKAEDLEQDVGNPSLAEEPQHHGTSGNPDTPVPGSSSTSPAFFLSSTSSNFTSSQIAPVSTCSSRFRVIKLDHGIGEPFRRGRWSCTEFYEKDTEPSSSSRTAENLKHTENPLDKDKQGSVSTSGVEPHTDSGYLSAPSNPPAEPQPQTFVVSQHGSGLVAHVQNVKSSTQQVYSAKQTQKPSMSAVSDFRSTLQSAASLALSGASLPQVAPVNQGPSLVMSTATVVPLPVSVSQPELSTGLSQTMGNNAVLPQMPAVESSASSLDLGVLNVPLLSNASNAPHSVPKQPQTQGGLCGAQMTQLNYVQIPSAEDSQRKMDVPLQTTVGLGRDAMFKRFIPEGFQLPPPAVSSLFGIAIPLDGDEDSASGANVVAIDNKIEQAMDLVKSHLMLAVREEVEVLKEQIKELYERNSALERENALLKSLASTDQLTQMSTHLGSQENPPSPLRAILQEANRLLALPPQPNVSTA